MPRQRITREMIVETAFALARRGGMEQVLVKNIALELHCSVQPVYSQFENMDALRRAVEERTRAFIADYLRSRVDPEDLLHSTGRAYAQLAREEPELFRIFVLQRRQGVASLEDMYRREANPRMAGFIADRLKLSPERARALHMNLLIYNIGLGVVFSVAEPGIPAEEIGAQLERAYDAFLQQAEEGEEWSRS